MFFVGLHKNCVPHLYSIIHTRLATNNFQFRFDYFRNVIFRFFWLCSNIVPTAINSLWVIIDYVRDEQQFSKYGCFDAGMDLPGGGNRVAHPPRGGTLRADPIQSLQGISKAFKLKSVFGVKYDLLKGIILQILLIGLIHKKRLRRSPWDNVQNPNHFQKWITFQSKRKREFVIRFARFAYIETSATLFIWFTLKWWNTKLRYETIVLVAYDLGFYLIFIHSDILSRKFLVEISTNC